MFSSPRAEVPLSNASTLDNWSAVWKAFLDCDEDTKSRPVIY